MKGKIEYEEQDEYIRIGFRYGKWRSYGEQKAREDWKDVWHVKQCMDYLIKAIDEEVYREEEKVKLMSELFKALAKATGGGE